MSHSVVDLSAHINKTVEHGHPADFPVTLRPVFFEEDGVRRDVPRRFAVVREDSGAPLGVVSDRYALVPHQRILDTVEEALKPLDLGPVSRGVYVDRGGARMRAIFKFPTLSQAVADLDEICPCLQIRNTYDGTTRITVHIGAFRFVCTNLAVGGGGVFAGGFMSVHAGEIPIDEVAHELVSYLSGFEAIVSLYQFWSSIRLQPTEIMSLLEPLPKRAAEEIRGKLPTHDVLTVYAAYNAATWHATHQMRSHRTAFELLAHINRTFQERFPNS